MALTQVSTDGIKNGTITGSDLATNVDLTDNQKLRVGTSQNLEIYNNSNTAFLAHTTGGIKLSVAGGSNQVQINKGVVDEHMAKFIADGGVELFHNNVKKFETTSYGNLSAAQVRVASSNATTVGFSLGDVGTGFYNSGSNAIGYSANGTQKWQINSLGDLNLADNVKGIFGDGLDLQIYHNGTNSFIDNSTSYFNINSNGSTLFLDGTGAGVYLRVGAAGSEENAVIATPNGAVELYYDGSKKFETSSAGVSVTGDINLLDNGTIFGGDDAANTLILRSASGNVNHSRIDIGVSEGSDNGGLHFYTAGSSVATRAMTIKGTSQNVGIGTTGPSSKLHVSVNSSETTRTSESTVFIKNTNNSASTCASLHLQASGSSSNIYKISTQKHSGGSGSEFHLDKGTNAIMQISGDNGDIKFGVSGTMINTFTPGLFNNTEGLGLEPRNGSIFLSRSGGAVLYCNRNSNGNTARFAKDGTEVGAIHVTGSGTSFVTSSDYRLKENVIPISDGITRLKTLKPSRFNFIADSETTVDGFLAHEMTAVPEAITGTKDEVDENNDPVYQGIDQSKLVPLLVAAVQEAIGKIEVLETEVAALKAA